MSGAWERGSSGSATPPVDVLKAGRKNITPRRRRFRCVDCEGPMSDETRRPALRIAAIAGWEASPSSVETSDADDDAGTWRESGRS